MKLIKYIFRVEVLDFGRISLILEMNRKHYSRILWRKGRFRFILSNASFSLVLFFNVLRLTRL